MDRKSPLCSRLSRKITIESVTTSADSFGEPIETFSTYAVRKARIVHDKPAERYNGYQEVNEYGVTFIVRYDSLTKDVLENMRILYNSSYYDVESAINPYGANKEIHIHGRNRRT